MRLIAKQRVRLRRCAWRRDGKRGDGRHQRHHSLPTHQLGECGETHTRAPPPAWLANAHAPRGDCALLQCALRRCAAPLSAPIPSPLEGGGDALAHPHKAGRSSRRVAHVIHRAAARLLQPPVPLIRVLPQIERRINRVG